MDISTLEALKPTLISYQTLTLLVLFIGIVWWAYGKRRKDSFDAIASSIFDEDEANGTSSGTEQDRAGANKK
ncbi:cbb3-type cytochrome oxidase subunit 3 [Oceanisphaera psychrotolerans]|jgi:cytochrome c oxidase cbb3-type subunit IV|uniref:Cytochrome c oxidase subunit CcoQ n=1 Tax=Oceanisphaera psychrotolerans TaxID=1414654 RepID=A0A1J4Q9Z5_9GAMM|nr:cbb3-type cytochrome c oxidase subunit 3 [Oceanisphaera psychrotolerans]OIN04318.1 cytochrome c oxidase subunit CcoQ [Oceanisphaera psychrotolerans]